MVGEYSLACERLPESSKSPMRWIFTGILASIAVVFITLSAAYLDAYYREAREHQSTLDEDPVCLWRIGALVYSEIYDQRTHDAFINIDRGRTYRSTDGLVQDKCLANYWSQLEVRSGDENGDPVFGGILVARFGV